MKIFLLGILAGDCISVSVVLLKQIRRDRYWRKEMEKCKKSPEYFADKYIRVYRRKNTPAEK